MPDALLYLRGQVELQAGAGDGKRPVKVSILAYAGDWIVIPGAGPTVFDLAGLDTSHPVQILADHANTLDGLLGSGAGQKTAADLRITGTLSRANPLVDRLVAMAADGVSFSASVGVQPIEREYIDEGKTLRVNNRTITAPRGGLLLVRKGLLRETSLVAIGADPESSVSIAARAFDINPKGKNMSTDTTPTPTTATLPADVQAEQSRVGLLRAAFDGCPLSGDAKDRAEAALTQAILTNEPADTFKARLLDILRASRPTGPAIHAGGRGPATPDVLEAAFLAHLGHDDLAAKTLGAEAAQRGRDLRVRHVLDIFRAGYAMQGLPVPRDDRDLLRAGASFSTTSLPGILGNAANKISLAAYQAAPSVARIVAQKLSANDFKTHTGYRLTANATFEEVGTGGEIKHGTLGEESYSFRVATFAKMFGLTRQEIINDDLGKFEEVPRLLGRGAAVKLEQLFWTLVLANTGSFFSGGNNNYISGADSALGITGLGLAVEALRKLTDANGDPIGVVPKYLAVPPELEAVADQLYASTNVLIASDVAVPDSNPYKAKYQPQVSPYLSNAGYSGYSETAWYLFGDPADVAAFGIAYLNGADAPTIESADTEFSTLGIQWRGYIDLGVCQIDKNGAVKAAGV